MNKSLWIATTNDLGKDEKWPYFAKHLNIQTNIFNYYKLSQTLTWPLFKGMISSL